LSTAGEHDEGEARMEPRLIPINALIALTTGQGGWPPVLAEAGYKLHGIEVLLRPSDGQQTCIDAILAHMELRIATLAECKSGQNLKERQLKAYGAVTGTHLARQVGFPFRDPTPEILLVGLAENRERLAVAKKSLGLELPTMLVSQRTVQLEDDLAGLKACEIAVPGWPPRIIPMDTHSPDEDLIRHLIPKIVAEMARGTEVIAVDSLLRQVIGWWDLYPSGGERKQLCARATSVLRSASERKYAHDFTIEERKGENGGVIRILRSPASYRPRGVTQGWQRLQRQTMATLGRRNVKPESPGQLELSFEALGLDAEAPGDSREPGR
jgi:hypothetical protein